MVDGVGYSARPRGKSVEEELEEKNEKKEAHLREMKRNLTISAIFTVPLPIAMADMVGIPMPAFSKPNAKPCELRVDSIGARSPNYLALDVVSSWMDLRPYPKGHPNMDSLVALGTSAAFPL